MYVKLDRTKEEISALKEAIALRPRIPEAHLGLGMAYLTMGDKKAATGEYNLLKNLDPQMADSLQQEIRKAPDH
jgi:tetratricopeptide (TPR) repeat protein